ncbi:MAG: radical SAM protein [bacterium]|nr:radical SAM protein [bacterium]
MLFKNGKLNPGYLKLDLYCRGIKIDSSCKLVKDARTVLRTRAGLGSGLEAVLPGELYTNIPLEEHFVPNTPYLLKKEQGSYAIYRDRKFVCNIRLPKRPKFYDQKTSSGKLMSSIGVMQGTYLGIYPTGACGYWQNESNCKFCSVGLNLGDKDAKEKSVQDVLETVIAAQEEEKITFVHFNTGTYQVGECPKVELDELEPYLTPVKKETGLLVGVQTPPAPDLKRYNKLRDMGVDHVSFCFELWNDKILHELCPGKATIIGKKRYLDAIEYCAKVFKPGAVSGEIIAGLEPVEDTLAAIEWITDHGAFPTICIFRPCVGTKLQEWNSPDTDEMVPIFRRMYTACIEKNVPIGIAPNANVSLVLLPREGRYFVEQRTIGFRAKEAINNTLKYLFRGYFHTRLWLHQFTK